MAATAATTVGVAVRTLFIVLLCVMVAAIVYVFAIGGYVTCFDLSARWAIAATTNIFINIVVIGAWLVYKESNWIKSTVIIAPIFFFGSIVTCGYILVQFFKLSPEEWNDPLYFVLVRRHRRDVMGHNMGLSVVTARVIVSALGCLTVGTLIYTIIVDGSLSGHAKSFSPCMLTTMIDVYIHVAILSVWVAYKESSWISAFLWILLLFCFGSITTCVYIVQELFYLSPKQPISLIIFNNRNRDLQSSDSLLMAHPDV